MTRACERGVPAIGGAIYVFMHPWIRDLVRIEGREGLKLAVGTKVLDRGKGADCVVGFRLATDDWRVLTVGPHMFRIHVADACSPAFHGFVWALSEIEETLARRLHGSILSGCWHYNGVLIRVEGGTRGGQRDLVRRAVDSRQPIIVLPRGSEIDKPRTQRTALLLPDVVAMFCGAVGAYFLYGGQSAVMDATTDVLRDRRAPLAG
jgi:hypothetical protein